MPRRSSPAPAEPAPPHPVPSQNVSLGASSMALGEDLFGGVETIAPAEAAEPLTGKIPSLGMLGLTAPPKESVPQDPIHAFAETAAQAQQLRDLDEPIEPPPNLDASPRGDFVFDVTNDAVDTGPPASAELPDDLGLILPGYDASAPQSLDDPTEAGLPREFRDPPTAETPPAPPPAMAEQVDLHAHSGALHLQMPPPKMPFDTFEVSSAVMDRPMPPPSTEQATRAVAPEEHMGALSTPPSQRAPTPRELAADVSRLAATLAAEGRIEEAGMLADVEALLLSMA